MSNIMSTSYESLHKQVNDFCAALQEQSEVEKVSLATREFDLTRDQVREILGVKDLIQFYDPAE